MIDAKGRSHGSAGVFRVTPAGDYGSPFTFWIRSCDLKFAVPSVAVTDWQSGGWKEVLDGGGLRSGEGSLTATFRAQNGQPHVFEGPFDLLAGRVLDVEVWQTADVGSPKIRFKAQFTSAEISFGDVDATDPVMLSADFEMSGRPSFDVVDANDVVAYGSEAD